MSIHTTYSLRKLPAHLREVFRIVASQNKHLDLKFWFVKSAEVIIVIGETFHFARNMNVKKSLGR